MKIIDADKLFHDIEENMHNNPLNSFCSEGKNKNNLKEE